MNVVQRIAKNTIVMFLANLVCLLLSFFYLMYTARYLGSAQYGILSFALAFVSITSFFMDIGLSSVMLRDVARDKSLARKYIKHIGFIKISLSIFTIILTVLLTKLFDYPDETTQVLYVITLSFIIYSFANFFGILFQSFERMEFTSLGLVLNNSLLLAGALIAISMEWSVLSFAFIYFISNVVILIYDISVLSIFILSEKTESYRFRVDISVWSNMVREAMPFGISSFFIRIYYYVATVIISLIIANPNEIMGWYNAAYRLVLVLSFIPSNFLVAIYPIMSRNYITFQSSLKFILEKSFKYMLIIAVPIGVGTTLLADRIINFTFGAEYAPSIPALQILVWSEALIFLNIVFGNFFNSTNQQIVVTRQTIYAAALNIASNLALIPLYSFIGASIATVATELFAFIYLLHNLRKSGYGLPQATIVQFMKIVFASSIMSIFLIVSGNINLFLQILLAACIYFTVGYFIGILDKSDIQLIRTLSGRDFISESKG